MFVDDHYRYQGIGKLLLEHAEKFFKEEGLSVLSLECSSINPNALLFYEHLGLVNRQTVLYKQI